VLRSRLAATVLAVATLAACSSYPQGPVRVHTRNGAEQGVNTEYGILTLGRTADAGPCEVTVFYGDGPSVEPGRIERIDDRICRVEIDLHAPRSQMSFAYPLPDDDLAVAFSTDEDTEYYRTRLARTADGVLAIERPGGFPNRATAVGAPVYRREDERWRLVGIVTGMVTLQGGNQILTLYGPRDLIGLTLATRDRRRNDKTVPMRDDIVR